MAVERYIVAKEPGFDFVRVALLRNPPPVDELHEAVEKFWQAWSRAQEYLNPDETIIDFLIHWRFKATQDVPHLAVVVASELFDALDTIADYPQLLWLPPEWNWKEYEYDAITFKAHDNQIDVYAYDTRLGLLDL